MKTIVSNIILFILICCIIYISYIYRLGLLDKFQNGDKLTTIEKIFLIGD